MLVTVWLHGVEGPCGKNPRPSVHSPFNIVREVIEADPNVLSFFVPTKLRNKITELKSNIAEEEEVLKSHENYFQKATLHTVTPEALDV